MPGPYGLKPGLIRALKVGFLIIVRRTSGRLRPSCCRGGQSRRQAPVHPQSAARILPPLEAKSGIHHTVHSPRVRGITAGETQAFTSGLPQLRVVPHLGACGRMEHACKILFHRPRPRTPDRAIRAPASPPKTRSFCPVSRCTQFGGVHDGSGVAPHARPMFCCSNTCRCRGPPEGIRRLSSRCGSRRLLFPSNAGGRSPALSDHVLAQKGHDEHSGEG